MTSSSRSTPSSRRTRNGPATRSPSRSSRRPATHRSRTTRSTSRRSGASARPSEDNGVLLLIAIEDRKLRIEVGEGIEGELTDLESGRIIRDQISPAACAKATTARRSSSERVRSAARSATRRAASAVDDQPTDSTRASRDGRSGSPPVPVPHPALPRLRRRRRTSPVFWGGGTVRNDTSATDKSHARRR